MRARLCSRLLVLAVVAATIRSTNATAREWSDATGKFKVEAELSEMTGGTVRLRKPSGEIVSVPLARLSKPDQEFIAKATKLGTEAQAVLRQHCYSCHGKDGSDEGGMNFVLSPKRLLERGKLVAHKPDESPLWDRVVAGDMPPAEVRTRLTDAQLKTLRDWISGGAFAPSDEIEGSPISVASMYEAMGADLKATDERSRIYYRYFTLTHLYNSGLSSDELNTVRLALAKLLNSLSWDRKIIAPQPIDPDQTIYRVDIRDLRWTVELWDVLASAYPYAVEHAGKPAAECFKLSGVKVPHLRADWFVAAASRPPLYHHLLQLPETLAALQEQMKLSFSQNLRQDRALRAGFTKSGVSQHPRVIERHETADGSCWVSYDFAGAKGARNFFNAPLAFEFDGNEVIFNLPNGLLAFAIFDRDGRRIDKAPTNIVRDLQSPDASVINGVSCMRCHAAGIIPKQDEVRGHAEANARAFGDKLTTVLALYGEPNSLQEAFKEDQTRYREAMDSLGIKRASAAGEPVYNTARRFRDPLDLVRASAELGRTSEELKKSIERDVELQRLVGPLRVDGGSIPREVFEEAFGSLLGPLTFGRHIAPVARIREPGESLASARRGAGDSADSPAGDQDGGLDGDFGGDGSDPLPAKDIRSGLAHHWKFDETKGNLARDSQGRNNASLGNWESGDPRWVPGKIGGALQFSRPEHIAIVGRDIDFGQMTIAFWLQVQLERGTNPRLAHPWVTLRLEIGQGVCALGRVTEPTKPGVGEWYHYAVTIDQAKHNAVIYRDGDEVASGKIEADRDKGLWVIGHNADPRNHGDTLNGLIDDLRIYKRLLKPEEISQLARWGIEERVTTTTE